MLKKSLAVKAVLFFIIFMFLTQNALAKNVRIISSGGTNYQTSSGDFISLIEETLASEKKRIKLVNWETSPVPRFQNIYLTNLPEGEVKDKLLKMDEKALNLSIFDKKQAVLLEHFRSIMIIPDKSGSEIEKLLLKTAKSSIYSKDKLGRDWGDIELGQAQTGKIRIDSNQSIGYLKAVSKKWQADAHWHLSYIIRYNLLVDNRPAKLIVLAKALGGGWRSSLLLKKIKKKNPDTLIINSGCSVKRKDDNQKNVESLMLLHEAGTDVLAPCTPELLMNKDVIFPYLQKMKGKKHIKFISANVFVKEKKEEKRLFDPYAVIERNGIKVGLVGLTDPQVQQVIESEKHVWKKAGDLIIKDPSQILSEEILPKLRREADVIVVFGSIGWHSMKKFYDALRGADILIKGGRRIYRDNEGLSSVNMKEYKKRRPRYPLVQLEDQLTHLNDIDISLAGEDINIKHKRIILTQDYESNRPFEEDADNTFIGMLQKKDVLFPDHRKLYPNDLKKMIVSEDETANLLAETVRRATHSEIGISQIWYHTGNMIGELDASIVNMWVDPDDNLGIIYLPGTAINELKAIIPNLEDGDRLALAGFDEKGGINGKSIKSDEYYKVAVYSSILQMEEKYPFIKKARNKTYNLKWVKNRYVEDRQSAPVPVVKAALQYLKYEKDNLYKSEEERNQDIKDNYEGRAPKSRGQFTVNLNEISFDFLKIDQHNNESFPDVLDSRITTQSQFYFGGILDLTADYRYRSLIFEAGTKMKYQRVKLRVGPDTTISEDVYDDLIFFGEVFNSWWQSEKMRWVGNLGPFTRLTYDTEFNASGGRPREKLLNIFLGFKTIEGDYLRSVAFGYLLEGELSGSRTDFESGLGLNFLLGHSFAANRLIWKTEGIMKYFFPKSGDTSDDLELAFSINTDFHTKIIGDLSIGPFINYFLYTAKTFDARGSQLYYGVSLKFVREKWKVGYQPFIL